MYVPPGVKLELACFLHVLCLRTPYGSHNKGWYFISMDESFGCFNVFYVKYELKMYT